MIKLESEIQQLILLETPKLNMSLFRNNSGCFTDVMGRVVRFGLGNTSQAINSQIKSSDLIGITQVVITKNMVGETIGVFTAVECKHEDWKISKSKSQDIAQLNFINFVKSRGGFASFVSDPKNLKNIITK